MSKILIVGNFGAGKDSFNGQTSKSRDYYNFLADRYGEESVIKLDTSEWRKKIVSSYFKLYKYGNKAENIVLLLGANAAKYILPVVCKIKKKRGCRIFWPVVGGSLLFDGKSQKKLLPYFSKVDLIYFETKTMVEYFAGKGFDNVRYCPVFSKRKLSVQFAPEKNNGVFKLCTYSRVCKEKGITEAVNAVKAINKDGIKCTLDIFGVPYPDYVDEFNRITAGTDEYIHLKDYLKGDGVIDKLYEYDAMLFPTFYDGEGFPIGVVECFSAGVPVIASDWHYNAEIIQHKTNGMIFDLKDTDGLVQCIGYLLGDRDEALKMRRNAYERSKDFDPKFVLGDLFGKIDNGD